MMISQKSEDLLALVHPELRAKWLAVATDLEYSHGRQLEVAQGLRTWKEQLALYEQGRTKPGKVVTMARPGYSWHCFGLAVDACFAGSDPYLEKTKDKGALLWREYGRLAVSHGLLWGGDWRRFPDRPHVELTRGLKLAQARSLFAAGGITSVWKALIP